MSELNSSNLKKEEGGQGPDLCGTTELTSPYFMVPPSGTTAQRPSGCAAGTLRFNTDIGSLEYFKGDTIGWESIVKTTPNLGGGTGSNTGTGARGIWGGGSGPNTDVIQYVTISTLGNASDFGNLTATRFGGSGASSRTRGLFQGGGTPTRLDTVDYITISSTGDALDFGNLTVSRSQSAGISNQIRGIAGTGSAPNGRREEIDYATIASTGNYVDFGNATSIRETAAGCQSTTRGIIGGGSSPSAAVNTIEYITIMTTGNALDFGDLTHTAANLGSNTVSSATRGVFAGDANIIDFITIATLGNAVDFGDLVASRVYTSGNDDSVRGMWAGGGPGISDATNIIEYIQIATTGDALDFGDLTTSSRTVMSGVSSGHGGL